jgi:phenylalanyl-tRNA synthetase alpha chain
MSQLQEQINQVQQTALTELAGVSDLTSLDEWRIKYLGKKGEFTGFLRGMGSLPAEERPIVGQAVNAAKEALETAVGERTLVLKEAALENSLATDKIDITLPGRPVMPGYIHVINKTLREIVSAFTQMGFQLYEGPEVELDYYNFQMLNMPPGHPARSMHDTFYFSDSVLLRTHTSPNQVRFMEANKPPIRIIVPGKCFRSEATDATHEFMFYQCEGLVVDKKVTLADLRGTLADFARRLFGQDRRVRFRCDYFPYVEPGVDLSISCGVCGGKGCRACKYSGWLEIMGAGMVHPDVLAGVGIDPEIYTGYAFGMGPERIAMLKYDIDDIRQYYRNDLRFLSQFA